MPSKIQKLIDEIATPQWRAENPPVNTRHAPAPNKKHLQEWLRPIGLCVDECFKLPDTPDRFAHRLRDWREEHKSRRNRDGVMRMLPNRDMTVNERYAVLAAIRSVVCENVKPADPWRTHHRKKNIARYIPGISFAALESRVWEVNDRDAWRLWDLTERTAGDLGLPRKRITFWREEFGRVAPNASHPSNPQVPNAVRAKEVSDLVIKLMDRAVWNWRDLSGWITPEALDELDKRGWIEFRLWGPRLRDDVIQGRANWFSPCQDLQTAGDLAGLLNLLDEEPGCKLEVRLSNSGRQEGRAARADQGGRTTITHPVGRRPKPLSPLDKTLMRWDRDGTLENCTTGRGVDWDKLRTAHPDSLPPKKKVSNAALAERLRRAKKRAKRPARPARK